ncbi:transposase domain-containing protein [Chachezhania sediminis]|uniref:transposase domain-containing protein n=1 Tax=Chachezhania sediminis TaxID=2599291 RepID=UPI00131B6F7D|nr:transposase domain-containing protein [Chachezhania sediminis]
MKDFAPLKEWWTVAELAEARLPDLPATRQGIEAVAKSQDWRAQPGRARRRQARGGGWEYQWRLLPVRAQRQLLAGAGEEPDVSKPGLDRDACWRWFEALPDATKKAAADRLAVLREIEGLTPVSTKYLAVAMVANRIGKSERTIWNWFGLVEGVDPADWLPYLAPRHRMGHATGQKAQASEQFYEWLLADFLRLEGPSFRSCYRRVKRLCKQHGVAALTERTAQRWLDNKVPLVTQVFMRKGERGLMECFPPQIRDRSSLSALEGVNADCHKIDVFVTWPGFDKPIRPQIVAFQDLYSGKILSWRVDVDPNKVAVMSAFKDLLQTWGIPVNCLFDNGREFANKWLTGGAPTRFRFKVREEEPLGVLALLGVKIHWATPGHGQAKPIERAFRDIASDVAKDPRFAGAYVGHRPDAKPENYMSRAVELEDFLAVVAEGIAEHNARQGRLSATAEGRSFDETFAESYARAPVRKATDEQLRLCLMAQQVCKLHKSHGRMTLHKNGYWSDWMNELAGQTVVARFNPEDLHAGAYVYSLSGEFLGYAACQEKSEFFDLASAQAAAKERSRQLKAQRRAAKALRPISVGGLARDLDKLPKRAEAQVEAKVVKLANLEEIRRLEQRQKGPLIARPLATPQTTPEQDAQLLDFAESFGARKAEPVPAQETARERFFRAREIEARSEAGEPVGREEAAWYRRYSETPEYRSSLTIFDRFGADSIR